MPQRFEQAVYCLPPHLRRVVMELPESVRAQTEEIRLRAGQALSPSSAVVTPRDLHHILENVSQGSLHTILDSLSHGFVTMPGGHRLGICGSAVVKDGSLTQFRDLSSLCIRIAREKQGIADKLLPKLLFEGRLPNILILSPPGVGKTTLLRDLVRLVSDGSEALPPHRVCVADERGELAACYGGIPQLAIGRSTDVMSGLSKAEASIIMLRGMSPQVLAMDEITAPEDVSVISSCAGCGVTVLTTAHAACADDLWKRPVYRGMLEMFERVIVISGGGSTRRYDIQEVGKPCPQ